MKLRKLIAGTLAATMVIGSGMTAFAANPTPSTTSATGTGKAYKHVNRDVTTVDLPTTGDTSIFKYYIDPERVVNDAKKLSTGNTAADAVAVTPNTDGVYFETTPSTANAAKSYASTSKAVTITSMASMPVKVTVKAELTEANASNDITTVGTQADLDKATTPALFMQLKFGTKLQGFTKTTAAEDSIVLLPKVADFEMNVKDDGSYEYKLKANATGNSVATQIIGKTNKATDGNAGCPLLPSPPLSLI